MEPSLSDADASIFTCRPLIALPADGRVIVTVGGTFGGGIGLGSETAAACVTVWVSPAMVTAPLRLVVDVFGATEYPMLPDPLPPVVVTVIQLEELVAFQLQFFCVVTETVLDPPDAANDCPVEESNQSH